MKEVVVILCLALQCVSAISQENMGIAHSNYAPTNSILLNPSSSADSKVFIDFNFIGLSAFGRNNYVFIDRNLASLGQEDAEGTLLTEQYNTTNAPYKGYVDFQLHAPSFSISYGKFGGGFHMGLRSVTSISGIPNHLANHAVNGFDFLDQQGEEFTTSGARIGTLSWLEYGVNFSYILSQKGSDQMTVGGTLKLLGGIAGGGMNIQKWNYQVENDSILNSFELRGVYGFSDIDQENPDASTFLGNGSGLGMDLGFNYKKMKKGVQGYTPHTPQGCQLKEYQYKFGLSILDIGSIKMRNGYYREFDIQDSVVWEDYASTSADGIPEIDQLINQDLLALGGSAEANQFKMLLPTAFSAQFDYNLGYGLYANATWVQGFNRKRKLGVERSSIIAITPRFESKPFDLALPLTIYNYESVKMGLAVRLYYLTIGTDHIGSLIGGGDVYGTDIYFSLKYTMFKPWYCKASGSKSKGRFKRSKGRGGQPCPSW